MQPGVATGSSVGAARKGGLSIGDLARETGAKAELIRWYEKQGLLPKPARSPSNYRRYGEASLIRLRFIRRARRLGFSLVHVRKLLALADDRGADCRAVDKLTGEHLVEIDCKIADLTVLRRELSQLLASCEGGAIAGCRVLQALAP